ncbi:MAG: hydrogenase maturation protease [Peptococcaceae bacterium]
MSTLVMGTGNDLLGDDSLGFHVLNKLRSYPLPPGIDTLYIGVDSTRINRGFIKYDRIIVIDAVESIGKIGDIYLLPAGKIPRQPRPYSLHDITWREMLDMLKLADRSYLFGIESTALTNREVLNPIIQGKFDYYAAVLYKLLTTNPAVSG